jgi:hypothetical protein
MCEAAVDEKLIALSDDTAGYLVRLAIRIGTVFLIGPERSFAIQANQQDPLFAR